MLLLCHLRSPMGRAGTWHERTHGFLLAVALESAVVGLTAVHSRTYTNPAAPQSHLKTPTTTRLVRAWCMTRWLGAWPFFSLYLQAPWPSLAFSHYCSSSRTPLRNLWALNTLPPPQPLVPKPYVTPQL